MSRTRHSLPAPLLPGSGSWHGRRVVQAALRRDDLLLRVGLAASLFLLMAFNYACVVSRYYESMGLSYQWPGIWRFCGAMFFAVAPVLFFPVERNRPSLIIVLLLYTAVHVPTCLVSEFRPASLPGESLRLQFLLCCGLTVLFLTYRFPLRTLKRFSFRDGEFWAFFVIGSFLVLVALTVSVGFRFQFHSFESVYDVREVYAELLRRRGRFYAYAVIALGNVAAPLLLLSGVVHRRLVFGLLAVFIQTWLYSLTGFKHLVFGLALVLIIAKAAGYTSGRGFVRWLLAGVFAAVGACTAVDLLSGDFGWSGLLVRRVFFVPGLLTAHYIDFFSNYEHLYLSHSIFGWFIDYPYELRPPHLIGLHYFGRETMGANVNLWGDGYANFGVLGVIGASLVLGAFNWCYDSFAQRIDRRFATSLLAVPAFSLTNSALLTTIGTHGLGLCLLTIVFFPEGKLTTSQSPLPNP